MDPGALEAALEEALETPDLEGISERKSSGRPKKRSREGASKSREGAPVAPVVQIGVAATLICKFCQITSACKDLVCPQQL